jgi:hypothetical protein
MRQHVGGIKRLITKISNQKRISQKRKVIEKHPAEMICSLAQNHWQLNTEKLKQIP